MCLWLLDWCAEDQAADQQQISTLLVFEKEPECTHMERQKHVVCISTNTTPCSLLSFFPAFRCQTLDHIRHKPKNAVSAAAQPAGHSSCQNSFQHHRLIARTAPRELGANSSTARKCHSMQRQTQTTSSSCCSSTPHVPMHHRQQMG